MATITFFHEKRDGKPIKLSYMPTETDAVARKLKQKTYIILDVDADEIVKYKDVIAKMQSGTSVIINYIAYEIPLEFVIFDSSDNNIPYSIYETLGNASVFQIKKKTILDKVTSEDASKGFMELNVAGLEKDPIAFVPPYQSSTVVAKGPQYKESHAAAARHAPLPVYALPPAAPRYAIPPPPQTPVEAFKRAPVTEAPASRDAYAAAMGRPVEDAASVRVTNPDERRVPGVKSKGFFAYVHYNREILEGKMMRHGDGWDVQTLSPQSHSVDEIVQRVGDSLNKPFFFEVSDTIDWDKTPIRRKLAYIVANKFSYVPVYVIKLIKTMEQFQARYNIDSLQFVLPKKLTSFPLYYKKQPDETISLEVELIYTDNETDVQTHAFDSIYEALEFLSFIRNEVKRPLGFILAKLSVLTDTRPGGSRVMHAHPHRKRSRSRRSRSRRSKSSRGLHRKRSTSRASRRHKRLRSILKKHTRSKSASRRHRVHF